MVGAFGTTMFGFTIFFLAVDLLAVAVGGIVRANRMRAVGGPDDAPSG